jgi:hypothetical protein
MRVGLSSQLVRMLGMHCVSLGNLHLQCLQLYQSSDVPRRRLWVCCVRDRSSSVELRLRCMCPFGPSIELRLCCMCPFGPRSRMHVR